MSEAAGQEPVQLGDGFLQDPMSCTGACGRAVGVSGHLANEWPGWLVTSYKDARRLLADPR